MTKKKPEFTVAKLIRELKKLDNADFEVKVEGCDCIGRWNGEVTLGRDGKSIIIRRIDGVLPK